MAAFLDLPTEVFAQIFSLIPRYQLTSCILVSKLWYAQSASVLYRNIDLTWSRPINICRRSADVMNPNLCLCEEAGTCRPEKHNGPGGRRHIPHMSRCLVHIPCPTEKWPSLLALVKTLIYSPSLARMVYRLRITGPVPDSVWTKPQHTGLSNDERCYIRSILPHDSYLSKTGWLRRLDNGCPHAFAALLLVCIPELRSLDLGPRFQDSLQILGPRLLARTLKHLDAAVVGITRASVWMGSGRAPFRQSDDFPQLLLLYLSGIRSLKINLPRPSTPYWSNLTCGTFTTSLEVLELAFTFLDEHDLARLLQACPHLRDFKYDHWTTAPLDDPSTLYHALHTPDVQGERLLDTQVLQSSLNIVQNSLVTLHIHIVPPVHRINQNLRSIDFSRFEALTELHAPLQLLADKDSSRSLADSLPPALRRLWLNDDATRLWLNHDYFMYPQDSQANSIDDALLHPMYTDQEVIDIISNLLSDWRAHVPQLQVLRLLIEHVHCANWRPRDTSYIRKTLELAGRLTKLHTTVTQVWRFNAPDRGQDPPHFSRECIKERQCSSCDYMAIPLYDEGSDGELTLRPRS
jgi:hypothetical protein